MKPVFVLRAWLAAVFLITAFFSSVSYAQLTVTPTGTAASLTAKLAGAGVTIVSDTLVCNAQANGTFVSVSTPIALDSGVILCTGKASQASGTEPALTSTNLGSAGDPDLLPYVGSTATTYDACQLIIHFVPQGDTISFKYQFGSEEYRQSTCGVYDDAFAFFISGPGVSASLPGVNMALVPGTNIPVAVNTVNSGVIGTTSGCALSNCTVYGPGSPFTAYYIDNTGGTQVTYRGYTDVFIAKHNVIACDTYRIKMSIVDAGNALYDSGVFIAAGSLSSNTYSFSDTAAVGATIDGTPNSIVKGCSPAHVTIVASYPNPTPVTLNLSYGGTAVSGVDVAALPTSITMPAGATSTTFAIQGLPTPVGGPRTLQVYLLSACGIADTVSLNILDSPSVSILTPDTAICPGNSFTIRTLGSAGLTYSWSPATALSSATVAMPVASPTANTTYTLTASLPNSGCPSLTRSVTVTMGSGPVSINGPSVICAGQSITLISSVSGPSGTYSWSPASSLNDAAVADPVASPTVTTVYTLTITDPLTGCASVGSFSVTVASPAFTILTPDTTICSGDSAQVITSASGSYTWSWSPAASINGANTADPTVAPHVTTTYSATATDPASGCITTQQVTVSVVSILSAVNMPADSVFCTGTYYTFSAGSSAGNNIVWSFGPGDTVKGINPVVHAWAAAGTYTIIIMPSFAGCGNVISQVVTVFPQPYISLGQDTSVCLGGGPVVLYDHDNGATPGASWRWNTGAVTPSIVIDAPGTYYATVMADGCWASDTVNVENGCYIDLPNVFTPNGDGLNDYFFPRSLLTRGLAKFSMSVFNRWGQEIFSTTNTDGAGWDGRFNDVAQSEGVYVYVIDAVFIDGQKFHKQGNVTLLR